MMTYGWAILIIVIVAAVLYSFGIFSPSSSISATITGFSGLGVTQAACVNSVNNQILELYVSNTLGYPVNVTKINVTGSSNGVSLSQNVNSLLDAGQSGIFYVNGACNKSSSSYSGSATITYTEPGQVFPGPYLSTGKVSRIGTVSNQNLVANLSSSLSNIQTSKGYSAPFALTITFWMKLSNSSSGVQISGYDSKSSESVLCCNWRVASRTTNTLFDPGYWGDNQFSWSLSTGRWYMVSMVLQNVTGAENLYYVYLNKTLASKGSASSSAYGIPQVDYLDFGYGPGSSPAMYGSLADIQIYTYNTSSAQIAKLFLEGVGGAPLSNANLIGWWPLDGNANDYSGNNNNGVATNVQWVSP
jgi:hypothetical protein